MKRAGLGSFLIALITVLPLKTVHAIDRCATQLGTKPYLSTLLPKLVSSLDNGLVFKHQTAGLCGTTCTVNLIQAALITSGKPLIENPVEFTNQINHRYPETLLSDGMPPAALDRLLTGLTKEMLKQRGIRLRHKILVLPEPYKDESPTLRITTKLQAQDFAEESGILKAISFGIFTEDRKFLGFHIVQILEGTLGNNTEIWVSDPNFPEIPVRISLKQVRTDENDATTVDLVPKNPSYYKAYSNGQKIFFRAYGLVTLQHTI